ncbi:MAG: aconitate hydratase [Nanoarchaeota archaeon]|nr:aconitate hydratase [Nanoarchaeota archaeon]
MSFLNQDQVQDFYLDYIEKLEVIKEKLNRPLTYTEKILFTHFSKPEFQVTRGKTSIPLLVDRVAMQDATAQMAILQFMLTGKKSVLVPTTIHCDHLIAAKLGAQQDLAEANLQNKEVYQFLKSSANKYGMGFWKPGSGIIHQVILENYVVPGQLMIGTDSHTPNAGGLGMVAIGAGGAEAMDAMAGLSWTVTMPKLIGIHLKGKLNGWTSPKDIILKVAEILTVKGGTGCIIEYFGEGARSISATGKATITNMGAEVGATTSLFPYDQHTAAYLRATQRDFVAAIADSLKEELQADPEVEQNPLAYFDEVIIIDLDRLEPQVVGPHTPDLSRSISALKEEVEKNNWPLQLSAALIGSCTNSSYEDMSRAAAVARKAAAQGLKAKVPFMITPGSQQIYATMKRDGLLEVFEQIGGTVLANACGPCIGQWNRQDVPKGIRNSIITSFNRNFKSRNDANPETHAFIASPEIVTVFALAGRLDFNPLHDDIDGVKLEIHAVDQLPQQGFVFDTSGYEESTGQGNVMVDPHSQRLALLQPFAPWKEKDFSELMVLVKAKGKCTTDHISPAGKWLEFRGHLDKISDNMFSGAVNAFNDKIGKGCNFFTLAEENFSDIARAYQKNGKGWIAVGDTNYGEGSSREHAAMEPRYLGCRAVLAKSFARIAETNLKKQGILPLWFSKETDYDKILEDDLIDVDSDVKVNEPVYVTIKHADGSVEVIEMSHTFSVEQLEWFRYGSALNWLRERS